MALNPIEILINARDNASDVFDRLNNKLKVIGVAIVGYFGVKAFAGIVEGAADFEQAMSRVQSATGASAEEMERLKKAAEDAGANTKYTSTEAAAALENLAKAGLSAGDAIEALPAVLALAQAGDVDLATSAEYVTKAVMGMGLAFTDSGRVADVLALGANASSTSVKGLAEALSYAAPTAQSLGVSLETTVAIIGQFASAGIDASRAGTALNSIMSQFSDPASKFRQELGAIGITTGDFSQALHELAASGARGSKAINAVGLEAGPALKAALNRGMPALDELKAKLDNAAGSAVAAAKVMEDNLNGSISGLSSAWDTVKNKLGTPVLPVLKDGVDQLAAAFRAAVADGTIQKFGEAIAAAFQSGITWIKAFAAEIDFTQLAADLRAFADRTGEVFAQIGEYATNAGNIVKLVYGVMSAGVNTVLGGVYLVGEAFAGVASNIQSGLALIYDAFAKVTFGSVSAAYKEAADAIRLSAEATWAASEELGKKSTAAFLSVADGAQLARDGFSGLASGATSAGAAAATAQPVFEAIAKSMGAQGAELVKLRAEYDALANGGGLIASADKLAQITALLSKGGPEAQAHAASIGKMREEYELLAASGNIDEARAKLLEIGRAMSGQKSAADAAWEAIRKLEAEYAALMASGNITGANQKTVEISAALRAMEPAAGAAAKGLGDVGKAAGAVAASVKQSSQQIEAAATAMAAYNTIAESGLKLEMAKEKAYEASAKAAGNEAGVLQSKIRQKEIEIKIVEATVKAMNDEADASIRVAEAKMAEARASKDGLSPELEAELQSRINLAKAKKIDAQATALGAEQLRAEITMLRNGTDARDKHNEATRRSASARDAATAALERENAAMERQIAAQEKSLDLKTRELKLQEANRTAGVIQNSDAVPMFNTIEEAEAWKKAWLHQYLKDNPGPSGGQLGSFMRDLTMFEWKKEVEAMALRDAVKNAAPKPDVDNVPMTPVPAVTPRPAAAPAAAPSGASSGAGGGSTTYVSNITIPGVGSASPRFADAASQSQTEDLLRKLAQAKGAAIR